MANYNGAAAIPIDQTRDDYFSHLTTERLMRKISAGDIALPLVRIEASDRCTKGVALADLATYLDERMAAARKECRQLCG